MKLLKFVDGDAPQSSTNVLFDNTRNTLSLGPNALKQWVGDVQQQPSFASSYWLIDDHGKPLCALSQVVLMKGEVTEKGKRPTGISNSTIEGVDFRSKAGKQLDTGRAEFGQTFKSSAAKPSLMNAAENREKKMEGRKREREKVAATIEKQGDKKK